jgi:filamentous hemagglutinin family protein
MKMLKPIASLLMLTASSIAFGNPEGLQLVAGEAVVYRPNENTLEIHASDQSILHWDSFNIGQTETTRFNLPSTDAAVLNRVLSGKMSEILGTLESNGHVFLLNSKGVLVGEDAVVNTASFIAAGFDIPDDQFFKGGNLLCKGPSGSIINLGKITAWDGDVLLVGYHVKNSGSIEAPNGIVALGAGTEVLLQPLNNEKVLIRAQVSESLARTGIENSGNIQALQAELKADGNVYAFAIKDSGKINALKTETQNGRILLVAEEGTVETSGSLAASGGEVRILGKEITLLEGADINVSSNRGGGTVLIGGDYQGTNPDVYNASYVRVENNTRIQADALIEGDGGKVIIWGDKLTSFFGSISAQGGSVKGNGGFVEVSSKGLIVPHGDVNTLAANGTQGTLLLDPCAVTIQTGIDFGYVMPVVGGNFDFNTSAVSNITPTALQNLLLTTNVTIDASATGTAANGSITVIDAFNWTTTSTLTMTANDAIGSQILVLANITGGGALTLNGTFIDIGDSAQSLDHAVTVNVPTLNIDTTQAMMATGGNLSIYGSSKVNASATLTANTVNITVPSPGNLFLKGGGIAGSGAFANIKTTGNITTPGQITATIGGDITLQAGDGSSASAAITGNFGSIDLTAGGNVFLNGSNVGSYSSAFIATFDSGAIDITAATGDVILDAGNQSGADARVYTEGFSDTDCHINITTNAGNIVLEGGTFP